MLILNEKIKNLAQKLERAETTIEQLRQHEYENEVMFLLLLLLSKLRVTLLKA